MTFYLCYPIVQCSGCIYSLLVKERNSYTNSSLPKFLYLSWGSTSMKIWVYSHLWRIQVYFDIKCHWSKLKPNIVQRDSYTILNLLQSLYLSFIGSLIVDDKDSYINLNLSRYLYLSWEYTSVKIRVCSHPWKFRFTLISNVTGRNLNLILHRKTLTLVRITSILVSLMRIDINEDPSLLTSINIQIYFIRVCSHLSSHICEDSSLLYPGILTFVNIRVYFIWLCSHLWRFEFTLILNVTDRNLNPILCNLKL